MGLIRLHVHILRIIPGWERFFLLLVLSANALGARIQPNSSRIADSMRHVAQKVDAILVTHGHFDHLLDVPIVMLKTHARLIASASAITLAKRAGVSSGDALSAG